MKSSFCKKVCPELAKGRIEAYLDRLYGYALSLTHHQELARDLVQICALKALAAKQVPLDEPAYRAWLFKILRNSYRDERRRERRDTVSLDQLTNERGLDGNVVPLQLGISGDDALFDQLTLQSAMKRLSHDHNEVLSLVDMIGFSYRETAALLNVPVGTIMSRISRARQVLLQELSREERSAVRLQAVRGKP